MGIGFICRPAGVEQKPKIVVTAPAGSTVTCSNGTVTETSEENNGTWTFSWLDPGTWEIFASLNGLTSQKSVDATEAKTYYVTLDYFTATIKVTFPSGAACTCTKGSEVLTAPNTTGSYTFQIHETGTWEVAATKSGKTVKKTVIVNQEKEYAVALTFEQIPKFTFSGEYEIKDDNGNPISTSQGNWNVYLLTSGNLKFTELNGAENGIDVFLQAGGAGGGGNGASCSGSAGGGGTNKTVRGVNISTGTSYSITIGSGGNENAGRGTTDPWDDSLHGFPGGQTKAFSNSVSGGEPGHTEDGTSVDGPDHSAYAFDGKSGQLYGQTGNNGGDNTGDGGDPGHGNYGYGVGKPGESGIVIIRNKR